MDIEQYAWSKLIKTRDGWKCVNAEKYPDREHQLYELNAHHIKPKKFGGKNIMSNGVTYCRACHAAEHPEYQEKFLDTFKLSTIQIKDTFKKMLGLESDLKYYRALHFLTGQYTFRPFQKEAIKSIVEKKKHVFVVMPTGFGKSLIYQMPALLSNNKPSLVISPLKALQTDQVTSLLRKWVPATYINSSLSISEIKTRIFGIINNYFLFVFIHPKQLLDFNKETQAVELKLNKVIAKLQFSTLVIDEAHVIESQGLSFIKEYYYLQKIHQLYNYPQVIMLTATASKKTRDFIIEKMGLERNKIDEFVGGFFRPEIRLEVIKVNTHDKISGAYIKKDEALKIKLRNKPEGNSIVFASTISQVDTLYENLKAEGFKVTKYHSKMTTSEKEMSNRSFFSDNDEIKADIMIATSAYGMGINIPNVHQVIHYSLPFTLTDYYQQFGRAGRDGRESEACLLFDVKESTGLIDFINKKTYENETDEEIKKLLIKTFKEERKALLEYIDSEDKWKYILDYFGEPAKSKSISRVFIILLICIIVLWLLIICCVLNTYLVQALN